jgi:hypothetical protein
VHDHVLTWAFAVERVTGIEPALSAWESERFPCFIASNLRLRVSVVNRWALRLTGSNGTSMARRFGST